MQDLHPRASDVDAVAATPRGAKTRRRDVVTILVGALAVVALGALLLWRSEHRVNRVPLAEAPRPVTAVPAIATSYRDRRSYVGAVEPWIEANVGPQFLSAYVQTVLVRPGASVKAGDVLATLDCSNPSAASRAVAMQARAVEARQRALADEAARVSGMLDGGFVAPNEVEQKTAQSSAEEAQLLETKAKLLSASLDVRDCVLRAPFDGEIATREVDPGAFVKPGTTIVSVVDRRTVRVVVDAPEKDFEALAPGAEAHVRMVASDARLDAPIARRAPKADGRTRTVRVEIDVPDPDRRYPVGTTAIVAIDVGQPVAATAIPVYAATQRDGKAKIFVVDGDVARARTVAVLGEIGGLLYADPKALAASTPVVAEGRELLADGDRVASKMEPGPSPNEGDASDARGGGFGRPL